MVVPEEDRRQNGHKKAQKAQKKTRRQRSEDGRRVETG
jgi:hypothetical protein